jgi:putative endopeptidase
MKKITLIASSITLLYSCKSIKNNDLEILEDVKKVNKSIDLSYMDKSIKPANDFFLFSNGKWVKNNPIPPSESRWGSFNELDKSNKEKLTKILEKCVRTKSTVGEDEFIVGNYYNSLTNMELRNFLGIQPIESELIRVKNLRSTNELINIIRDHHHIGIQSLFSFGVGQDLKNINQNIAYIGQGGIGLPNKEYYSSENKKEILDRYKEHISLIFTLLNYSEKEAYYMAEDVVQFEKQLANSMMSPSELRIPEKTYNKMSRQDCINLMGELNGEHYFNTIGIGQFDSLVVSQPNFLTNAGTLITSQSLDVWKNYLLWNVINHYADKLNETFVQVNFNFYSKVLSGKTELKPINERAIDEITNKEFGEILGKLFVKDYFSQNAQNKVNVMVDNLLFVFKERIHQLDWMSDVTKNEAIIKLNAIGRKLGYPSKWGDYTALNFNPKEYINNVNLENKFSFKKNMSELNAPVDKMKWGMPAHMVNAYYHPLLNEIAFPAGIMQPPFFDEEAEDAVNYGRIGMVIGHEFTHGFDDMGSKFAADGSFRNWWTENDRLEFEKKTQLLGNTFSEFCPIEGHCVNPDLTMGENIADLGGLTMAYYAFTKTTEFKSGKEINGFSPAQRFFIAYAQLWKINYTPEEMKNRIANDPHSPGMYRVNGPLKNCPEFFEAFNIPEKSPMRNNVKKIAKIW